MANIHINSETSTHQEPFSAKTVDVLALFCIFSAFLDIVSDILLSLETKAKYSNYNWQIFTTSCCASSHKKCPRKRAYAGIFHHHNARLWFDVE